MPQTCSQKTKLAKYALLGLIALGLLMLLSGPVQPGRAASLSNKLQVATATYLGTSGNDSANAVDIAPDDTVVVGGLFKNYAPANVTSVNLNGGGDGAIVRLSQDGHSVLSVSKVVTTVADLKVASGGQMVACGSFGLLVLNADATQVSWSASPGNVSRCALGSDGTTAGLVGTRIYSYNSTGNPLANWDIANTTASDLVIDSASQTIITTGYQVYTNQRVASLKGWSYTGSLKWKDYDFSLSAVNASGQLADTTGTRVNLGRDGLLYFAGFSAGGNSIFGRDPKNINQTLPSSQLIRFDKYNDPYNTSSNNIGWYGRFAPGDGSLLKGQFLLARLDSNKGNTIQPTAIMADENGRVYLVGRSAYQIENRSSQQISGITVGAYSGDIFLLVVKSDFSQRLNWTVFTAPDNPGGYSANLNSVSVRNGNAALAGVQRGGKSITYQALQPNPTATQGYLAVWPQIGETGQFAAPPQLAASFAPNPVAVGGISRLNLSLTNSNATALTNINFTASLPAQLQVAANPDLTDNCSPAGTVIANPGSQAIRLKNGGLSANQLCTISLNIVSTGAGSWTATVGPVSALESGGAVGGSSSVTLQVVTPVFTSAPGLPDSTFKLGAVAPNSTKIVTLTVQNTGYSVTSLSVNSSGLSGPDAARFGLSGNFPLILAGGTSQPLTLSCTPTTSGLITATLTLTTNDPNRSNVTYNLQCVGGFVVTEITDDGSGTQPGSLSYVLKNQANTSGAGVVFALTSGSTIRFSAPLVGPLPDGVVLDGGCDANGPKITLRAEVSLPNGTVGMRLGHNNFVNGLQITGFPGQQLRANVGGGNQLRCVQFRP